MILFRNLAFGVVLAGVISPAACPPPNFRRLSVSPSSLTFSPQVVSPEGKTSAAQAVTVKNTGTGNLSVNLTGIVSSGYYGQTSDCPAPPAALAVNATCTINVTFAPRELGAINGAITITDNAAGAPHIISLSGAGITPVAFSPDSLDFGTITVGASSAAKSVALTNQQSTGLTISAISVSGNYFQVNDCPASLAAGKSCTINVTFHPTVAGPVAGALTVSTDAFPGTQPVNLMGSASGLVTSQVAFSPASLAFGNQEAGTTSAAKTVTLTNTSTTGSLTINSVNASGPNYVATNTCAGKLIAPGGTCAINVSFHPTSDFAPVSYAGAITVIDTDSTSPQVVPLSGAGVAPVTASPDTLNFGTLFPGTTSATQTLTVANNDAAAEDLSISISGRYSLNKNNCLSSVPAGGKCSLDVTFPRGLTGSTNGAVTISPSTGGFLSPQVVSLSACSTDVGLAPLSLNFGGVPVGVTSEPETATLTKVSGPVMNISGTSIAGTNAGDFAISNSTCGLSLDPGASCAVNLTFKPTASGTKSGILNISDDGGCSPQQVNLIGGSSSGPFALTVSALQASGNGVVTSNPVGIDCGSGGSACSAGFSSGARVTLNATADTQSMFSGWGGACTGTGSCVLDMAADKQVTATFNRNPQLAVGFAGSGSGTVTSSPAGIGCPASSCSALYTLGTVVTLSAVADAGSSFAGWSGPCTGSGNCMVTMNADQNVTATFNSTAPPDFSLSASPATPNPVPRGGSSASTATVTSVNGFNSAVSFTCSVQPAPALAPTCSMNPPSVTPPANGSATSRLTVNTAGPSASLTPQRLDSRPFYALWLPIPGLALVGIGFASKRSRKRKLMGLLLGCMVSAGLIFQAACGGSGSNAGGGGTTPGTYTITITATSGAIQKATQTTLTVQ